MNYPETDTIKTLRKKLLIFISCIPSDRQKSKTTIQKLNFFAQFEDLLPFFPKTANHFGSYSSDIEYLLNDLINKGQLENGTYIVDHWFIDKFTMGRDISIFSIPPDVQKKIPVWARELNIDLSEYRNEVIAFCKRYEHDAGVLGNLSKKRFLETIKQHQNHLFFDKSLIDDNLKNKLKFIGIDTIGIEGIFKIPVPIISKSDRTPAEIVSGIATEIINRKENLESYHFNIRSIHANFPIKGKISLLGQPVFLVGYFVRFSPNVTGNIAMFRDSVVKPELHEIEVIIGKNGKFCPYHTIDSIKNDECIVIGVIDENKGKPIIKVIGLIRIDSLPFDFIRNIRNEPT